MCQRVWPTNFVFLRPIFRFRFVMNFGWNFYRLYATIALLRVGFVLRMYSYI